MSTADRSIRTERIMSGLRTTGRATGTVLGALLSGMVRAAEAEAAIRELERPIYVSPVESFTWAYDEVATTYRLQTKTIKVTVTNQNDPSEVHHVRMQYASGVHFSTLANKAMRTLRDGHRLVGGTTYRVRVQVISRASGSVLQHQTFKSYNGYASLSPARTLY